MSIINVVGFFFLSSGDHLIISCVFVVVFVLFCVCFLLDFFLLPLLVQLAHTCC